MRYLRLANNNLNYTFGNLTFTMDFRISSYYNKFMNPNSLKNDEKSIGVTLSGGGARGLAHIGFLNVLHEYNINISAISGCSMGGLIAALFACGFPVQEIKMIARKYTSIKEMIKLVDPTPHRKGIIESSRLRNFLSKFIDPHKKIENSNIPLALNSVDLNTSREVILDHGNLLEAIMATTAVPGLFEPIKSDLGYLLADGGIIDNIPVRALRSMTTNPIVAVDVHLDTYNQPFLSNQEKSSRFRLLFPDFLLDFYRAEMIMISEISTIRLKEYPPDLLIRPEIDPEITMFFGFQRAAEIIDSGEITTRRYINEILGLLSR
jgi:NTE family protein